MSATEPLVANVREAAQAWLWHAGEENRYALRLHKLGHDAQATSHADAAAQCSAEAQRLLELNRRGFVRSPTLLPRRLARSVRVLDAYIDGAVTRRNRSEALLRPHKPAPKR